MEERELGNCDETDAAAAAAVFSTVVNERLAGRIGSPRLSSLASLEREEARFPEKERRLTAGRTP